MPSRYRSIAGSRLIALSSVGEVAGRVLAHEQVLLPHQVRDPHLLQAGREVVVPEPDEPLLDQPRALLHLADPPRDRRADLRDLGARPRRRRAPRSSAARPPAPMRSSARAIASSAVAGVGDEVGLGRPSTAAGTRGRLAALRRVRAAHARRSVDDRVVSDPLKERGRLPRCEARGRRRTDAGRTPASVRRSRTPGGTRGRGGARGPGLDLGELLGGEHRPQRRDRHLDLVERGLAGGELLEQRGPGFISDPDPAPLSMCLAAKRMTS